MHMKISDLATSRSTLLLYIVYKNTHIITESSTTLGTGGLEKSKFVNTIFALSTRQASFIKRLIHILIYK